MVNDEASFEFEKFAGRQIGETINFGSKWNQSIRIVAIQSVDEFEVLFKDFLPHRILIAIFIELLKCFLINKKKVFFLFYKNPCSKLELLIRSSNSQKQLTL